MTLLNSPELTFTVNIFKCYFS